MCLNPKWVYKKGKYKQDNYHGRAGDFYEIGTYSKCGTCAVCIAEKANNWVIRCKYEAERNPKKCFITLTYEANPIILIKKDLQDFIKRFRAKLEYQGYKEKIRYFAVGEYGSSANTSRPHFHLIIYGWEDEKPEYIKVNKKGKIVLKSKLIEECWGKGITSYQVFHTYEMPYIALYNTANEEFKKSYLITKDNLKWLENYSRSSVRFHEDQRKNLQEELKRIRSIMEDEKKNYYLVKEFNTWSIALGWEEFHKEYAKSTIYDWKEYILDSIYVTPTPWVKKLANSGDYEAIKEMKRREELIEQSASEDEEREKNELRVLERRKKEILEWIDKKDKIEYL